MIVVSNSSPLIALSRIGRLDILASFYERILVPAEVHHEVTVDGCGLPGAEEVRNAVWIEVAPQDAPTDPLLEQACQDLGAGERGAILTGQESPSRPRPFGRMEGASHRAGGGPRHHGLFGSA